MGVTERHHVRRDRGMRLLRFAVAVLEARSAGHASVAERVDLFERLRDALELAPVGVLVRKTK